MVRALRTKSSINRDGYVGNNDYDVDEDKDCSRCCRG